MLTCAALAIGLNLATYHVDHDPHLHSINPGVYATCDHVVAGAYRNSYGRVSLHGGYVLQLGGVVDVELGLASGYGRRTWVENGVRITQGAAPIIPLVVPSILLGNARVGLIPPMGAKHKGALTLALEW